MQEVVIFLVGLVGGGGMVAVPALLLLGLSLAKLNTPLNQYLVKNDSFDNVFSIIDFISLVKFFIRPVSYKKAV